MVLLLSIIFLTYSAYVFINISYMPYLIGLLFLINTAKASFNIEFVLLRIGGIQLYPSDIVIIIMLLVLFIKGIKIHKNIIELNLSFVVFLIILSTLTGFYVNGITSEFIAEIRKFYGFIVPVIYFYNRGLQITQEKLIKFFDRLMEIVLFFLGVCWTSYLIFGAMITNLEFDKPLRVITSDGAMAIALYSLWCLYRDLFIRKSRKLSIRTIIFLMSIIILQHNSVWTATLIGGISIILINYKIILVKRPKFLIQVVLSIIGISFVFLFFQKLPLIQTIITTLNKYNDVGNGTGTFGTRMEVWRGLINNLKGYEWLVGQTFGSGYHVWYKTSYWNHSPHSGYIEGLMRIGTIGMTGLLVLMITLIKKSVINKANATLSASIIISILVYWVAYSFTLESGAIIGCIAYYTRKKQICLIRKI